MTTPVRISLAGVGLIGRRHADIIQALPREVELESIVDPSDVGRSFAESMSVPWYPSLAEMFSVNRPDGAILATPNQVHLENGLECVAANCAMLVEKPIAPTGAAARRLVDAAAAAGVPILVGHHRRHNTLIRRARAVINEGRLGRIVAVHGIFWMAKPDDYFAPEWRRKKGAGPILVNAIHDIDLMRFLCGEIHSVQAITSNAIRGFETEDTAAILIRFESGAVGTFSLSDAVTAPWSWEMTTGENPDFARVSQSCYMFGGTKASLSIPDMRIWDHGENGSWKSPIRATSTPGHDNNDPLVAQISHFANVIRGREEPLVSGEDAMKSLCVIEAIHDSAASGKAVLL